jgi:hypothetical protein
MREPTHDDLTCLPPDNATLRRIAAFWAPGVVRLAALDDVHIEESAMEERLYRAFVDGIREHGPMVVGRTLDEWPDDDDFKRK